jgi:hypothetical protein
VRNLDEFDRVFNVRHFLCSNGPTLDLTRDCMGSSLKRSMSLPA